MADDVRERHRLRPGEFERQPRRCLPAQEEGDSRDDIIELYDLDASHLRHNRQDRQSREPAEQRAAAISRASDDHRRPQNDPIQIAPHQRLVAGKFGLREPAGRFAIDADRRDMHDPANAHPFAGFEQSGHAVEMNALQGVARGVLQSAGAIDDSIDAPDMS